MRIKLMLTNRRQAEGRSHMVGEVEDNDIRILEGEVMKTEGLELRGGSLAQTEGTGDPETRACPWADLEAAFRQRHCISVSKQQTGPINMAVWGPRWGVTRRACPPPAASHTPPP